MCSQHAVMSPVEARYAFPERALAWTYLASESKCLQFSLNINPQPDVFYGTALILLHIRGLPDAAAHHYNNSSMVSSAQT